MRKAISERRAMRAQSLVPSRTGPCGGKMDEQEEKWLAREATGIILSMAQPAEHLLCAGHIWCPHSLVIFVILWQLSPVEFSRANWILRLQENGCSKN